MTSRTFPVTSQQISTIPSLDDHLGVLQEPYTDKFRSYVPCMFIFKIVSLTCLEKSQSNLKLVLHDYSGLIDGLARSNLKY